MFLEVTCNTLNIGNVGTKQIEHMRCIVLGHMHTYNMDILFWENFHTVRNFIKLSHFFVL